MKTFYEVLRNKVWDKIRKQGYPEYLTGSTEEM
jgi:hypothetical protein